MRFTITVAAVAGALLLPSAALANGSGGSGGGGDNPNSGPANERVTFCHATGSATNPFVTLTIRDRAVFEGHAGQHPGDIIPPFTFRLHGDTINFPGQNFDARGQAILANGCVVPATPPPVVNPPVNPPVNVTPPPTVVTVPVAGPITAPVARNAPNRSTRRCVRKRNRAGKRVFVCHRGLSAAEKRRIARRHRQAEARRRAQAERARKRAEAGPSFTG